LTVVAAMYPRMNVQWWIFCLLCEVGLDWYITAKPGRSTHSGSKKLGFQAIFVSKYNRFTHIEKYWRLSGMVAKIEM
jgi:hypothetical protein